MDTLTFTVEAIGRQETLDANLFQHLSYREWVAIHARIHARARHVNKHTSTWLLCNNILGCKTAETEIATRIKCLGTGQAANLGRSGQELS